jgi:hypothetical protein
MIIGVEKFVTWSSEHRAEMQIKDAKREVLNARFPKVGDTIELNGKEVVIMKEYFWCQSRTFRVRLPNGELTDILRKETIDIKPIRKIPEKRKTTSMDVAIK